MQELPVMTGPQALKNKVTRYITVRGCKECGGRERYIAGSFSAANIACVVCEPPTEHRTSLCNINAATSKHNAAAKKQWNSRFCIPVVYGGMNTK